MIVCRFDFCLGFVFRKVQTPENNQLWTQRRGVVFAGENRKIVSERKNVRRAQTAMITVNC